MSICWWQDHHNIGGLRKKDKVNSTHWWVVSLMLSHVSMVQKGLDFTQVGGLLSEKTSHAAHSFLSIVCSVSFPSLNRLKLCWNIRLTL